MTQISALKDFEDYEMKGTPCMFCCCCQVPNFISVSPRQTFGLEAMLRKAHQLTPKITLNATKSKVPKHLKVEPLNS